MAHGGEGGKRAANEGLWRTSLNVAALSKAEMSRYLHVSSYGPAVLPTTGMAARE